MPDTGGQKEGPSPVKLPVKAEQQVQAGQQVQVARAVSEDKVAALVKQPQQLIDLTGRRLFFFRRTTPKSITRLEITFFDLGTKAIRSKPFRLKSPTPTKALAARFLNHPSKLA